MAPAQTAIRVTIGVASTHPMKATAKINKNASEIIMDAGIRIVPDQAPQPALGPMSR
jgi:hypothetical protein